MDVVLKKKSEKKEVALEFLNKIYFFIYKEEFLFGSSVGRASDC